MTTTAATAMTTTAATAIPETSKPSSVPAATSPWIYGAAGLGIGIVLGVLGATTFYVVGKLKVF